MKSVSFGWHYCESQWMPNVRISSRVLSIPVSPLPHIPHQREHHPLRLQNLQPRLHKMISDFGGVDAMATLVGLKTSKHDKVPEAQVFKKLLNTTYQKWKNTRSHARKADGMSYIWGFLARYGHCRALYLHALHLAAGRYHGPVVLPLLPTLPYFLHMQPCSCGCLRGAVRRVR
jgi:hypothetical protein